MQNRCARWHDDLGPVRLRQLGEHLSLQMTDHFDGLVQDGDLVEEGERWWLDFKLNFFDCLAQSSSLIGAIQKLV